MADLQDMLLFERYYRGEANKITERIASPRNNPFDDYDDSLKWLTRSNGS